MEVRDMSLKGRRKRQHNKPGSHVDKYLGLAEKSRQANAADQTRWERRVAEATQAPAAEVEPTETATE